MLIASDLAKLKVKYKSPVLKISLKLKSIYMFSFLLTANQKLKIVTLSAPLTL